MEKYNKKIIDICKKSYGECYNETMDRINVLKSLGYNVVSIWESDWETYNV